MTDLDAQVPKKEPLKTSPPEGQSNVFQELEEWRRRNKTYPDPQDTFPVIEN